MFLCQEEFSFRRLNASFWTVRRMDGFLWTDRRMDGFLWTDRRMNGFGRRLDGWTVLRRFLDLLLL